MNGRTCLGVLNYAPGLARDWIKSKAARNEQGQGCLRLVHRRQPNV